MQGLPLTSMLRCRQGQDNGLYPNVAPTFKFVRQHRNADVFYPSPSSSSDLCAHAGSALDFYAEVPGGPGRWTLPDVETGLDSMAAVYSAVDTMSNQITLFTTLQGITLQLLILRLIKILSAQKRLSILTKTTIKVI